MQRPSLARRCTDSSSSSKRPVHLLLRGNSAQDVYTVKPEHSGEYTPRSRPLAYTRPSSSSSCSSDEDSDFDDDLRRGTSAHYDYYSDDTEDDDEADMTTLNLSSSGFTSMPAQLLAETDCCMQIETLDMSQNILDGTQEEYLSEQIVLPNLSSLCLEDCNVTSLEPLCKHLYAPNLRVLNISNHRLRGSVPQLQRYFPKLDTLIASNGKFEHLDESVISSLTRIDLSNNNLTDTDGSLCERCRRQGTELVL